MATSRYCGEQHDRHKGRLFWPGHNGIPFRGVDPPLLKRSELSKLLTVGDTYQKAFRLAEKDDAEYYSWVRERARNGWFTVDRQTQPEWNEDKTNVNIYLEWTQVYLELPNNVKLPGSNANVQPAGTFSLRDH